MVLYMVCDNDNYYTNTFEWGSTGTFTGLMVVMEAQVQLERCGTLATPSIVGALFCAFDVTISGASSICYNQTVIDNVTQTDLTTKSRTTVPGTWQELSPNLYATGRTAVSGDGEEWSGGMPTGTRPASDGLMSGIGRVSPGPGTCPRF